MLLVLGEKITATKCITAAALGHYINFCPAHSVITGRKKVAGSKDIFMSKNFWDSNKGFEDDTQMPFVKLLLRIKQRA